MSPTHPRSVELCPYCRTAFEFGITPGHPCLTLDEKRKRSMIAVVPTLPRCDIRLELFCGTSEPHPAEYDAVVKFEGHKTWAYVCKTAWKELRVSSHLGVGVGQHLVLDNESSN